MILLSMKPLILFPLLQQVRFRKGPNQFFRQVTKVVNTVDCDKAATAARVMPWHAPPGLDISTSDLNFADLKIDGTLSDDT